MESDNEQSQHRRTGAPQWAKVPHGRGVLHCGGPGPDCVGVGMIRDFLRFVVCWWKHRGYHRRVDFEQIGRWLVVERECSKCGARHHEAVPKEW